MKPTIQITDNRIADNIPCAPENVEVQIVNAVPQTFQVVAEDGTESEVTLNIKQAGATTTLKDFDNEVDTLTPKETLLVADPVALDKTASVG
jgi:hypothetical protein